MSLKSSYVCETCLHFWHTRMLVSFPPKIMSGSDISLSSSGSGSGSGYIWDGVIVVRRRLFVAEAGGGGCRFFMIWPPGELVGRRVVKVKTHIQLLHPHGIQEYPQELVCVLLGEVEVLVILATEGAQYGSKIGDEALGCGGSGLRHSLGAQAFPPLQRLRLPCLMHHVQKYVADGHRVRPWMLVWAAKAVAICQQR